MYELDEKDPLIELRLYRRRWFIIGMYMTMEVLLNFQWVELSIINNILVDYYGVTPTMIEWTSQVYSLSNIVLAVPSIHILRRLGTRKLGIMAVAIMCTGTWLKVISVAPDRFYLVMIGQILAAISYVLVYPMVALLPALWFGEKEISFAGALPISGMQLGSALGFLIPPQIVQHSSDVYIVEDEMRNMHVYTAIVSSVILILTVLFFQAKPELPPSVAIAIQDKSASGNICSYWRELISTRGYILATSIYILINSISISTSTFLNELVLLNFPGANTHAGNIGFLLVTSGAISLIIMGRNLDKTKRFKEFVILTTTATCIATILFGISLKCHHIAYVYISAALLGSFMISTLLVAIQISIETSYPVPEPVSTTTLFVLADVGNCAIFSIVSSVMKHHGDIAFNAIFVFFSFLSTILASIIPVELRRHDTEMNYRFKYTQLEED